MRYFWAGRFRGLAKNYFRGAHAFILVYDITDKKCFDKLRGWMNDAKEKILNDYKMIVVGNKKDCNNMRKVDFSLLDDFRKKLCSIYKFLQKLEKELIFFLF